MKFAALLVLAVSLLAIIMASSEAAQQSQTLQTLGLAWESIQKTIENYLGRPYVWGSVGLKSFDCSGFVWRVMLDNGIMMKRTTARKLYFSLPDVSAANNYNPGTLVFFDDLKHVGFVKDYVTFYHAQVNKGTNLSVFDPYWRHKICGFRIICP